MKEKRGIKHYRDWCEIYNKEIQELKKLNLSLRQRNAELERENNRYCVGNKDKGFGGYRDA